jgi:hypothetical protein
MCREAMSLEASVWEEFAMALEARFVQDGNRLLYRGQPVRLAGIYPRRNSETGIEDLPQVADYNPFLQPLSSRGNNFFRHWMIPYWHYRKSGTYYSPFVREANGKWDLTRFNDNYFVRLERLIQTSAAHGIVVLVSLFDATGLKVSDPGQPESLRWAHHPWNSRANINGFIVESGQPPGGAPEFFHFRTDPRIENAQRLYLQKVLAHTKGYWNVFYEIMNEPPAVERDKRMDWANWVTGLIHAETEGTRMIFYNDHSGDGDADGAQDGADVHHWKDNQARFGNYGKLNGVTFHGSPTKVIPSSPDFRFRNEKIFQVSSDAAPASEDRDGFLWNRAAKRHAFNNGMLYQAETLSLEAADAIGGNDPKPTRLIP